MTQWSPSRHSDPQFQRSKADLTRDIEAIDSAYLTATQPDRERLDDSYIDADAPCGTAQGAEAETASECESENKRLADLNVQAVQARRNIDHYRVHYGIKHDWQPVNFWFLVTWTILCIAVETGVNASFLFAANVSGLIPVLAIAFTLSCINLGGAFLTSRWTLNLSPLNAGPIKRTAFFLALLVLVGAVIAVNLAFGDYRANVAAPGNIDLNTLHQINILRPVLHEPSYEAWMAIGVGLIIFALSWWEFAQQWERCIGFGRASKRLKALQSQIDDAPARLFAIAKPIVEDGFAVLDEQGGVADDINAEARNAATRIDADGARKDAAIATALMDENANYADYCSRVRSISRVTGDIPQHYFEETNLADHVPAPLPKFDTHAVVSRLEEEHASLKANIAVERQKLSDLLSKYAPKETSHVFKDPIDTDPTTAASTVIPAEFTLHTARG